MDPADKQGSLSGQGALFGQHKQLLMGLMDNRSSVAQVVSDLEQKVLRLPGSVLPNPASAIWAGAAPLPDAHVCEPKPFYGALNKCHGPIICNCHFPPMKRDELPWLFCSVSLSPTLRMLLTTLTGRWVFIVLG